MPVPFFCCALTLLASFNAGYKPTKTPLEIRKYYVMLMECHKNITTFVGVIVITEDRQ